MNSTDANYTIDNFEAVDEENWPHRQSELKAPGLAGLRADSTTTSKLDCSYGDAGDYFMVAATDTMIAAVQHFTFLLLFLDIKNVFTSQNSGDMKGPYLDSGSEPIKVKAVELYVYVDDLASV